MSVYTFTLESFRITHTRAPHNDTDHVAMAVQVGDNPPVTVPTNHVGDVNDGIHAVNMAIDVDVPPDTPVAFSYTIVNSAGAPSDVAKTIEDAAQKGASAAITAGATLLGSAAGGPLGAGIAWVASQAGTWIVDQVLGLFKGRCDGPVAAGQHVLTAAQLAQQASGGSYIKVEDDNPGGDSAWGCGSNSHYYVVWSVAAKSSSAGTTITRRLTPNDVPRSGGKTISARIPGGLIGH